MMSKKSKIFLVIRVLLKVALIISIFIALDLTKAYLVNLGPTDGLGLSMLYGQWYYGDNGWTYAMLWSGCTLWLSVTAGLFCANTALDVAAMIAGKRQKQ